MTTTAPRHLADFARASGYEAVPCRDCRTSEQAAQRCTNCGGSGRLWTSPRGSLSDEGMERLRHLLGDVSTAEKRP